MLVQELEDSIPLKSIRRPEEPEGQMPVVRWCGSSRQPDHPLAQEGGETVSHLIGQGDREEQPIAHWLPQSTPWSDMRKS